MAQQAQSSTPKPKTPSTPVSETPATATKTGSNASKEITAEVTLSPAAAAGGGQDAKAYPQGSKHPAAATPPPTKGLPAHTTQGAVKHTSVPAAAAPAAAAATPPTSTKPQAAVVHAKTTSVPGAVSDRSVMTEEMLDAMQGGNVMIEEPFSHARSSIGASTLLLKVTGLVPPSAEAAAAAGVDSQGVAPIRDVDGIETFKRRRSSVSADPQTLLHAQHAMERVAKKAMKPRIDTIDEQHLRSKGELALKSVLVTPESRGKRKMAVKFCDVDGVELSTTREYYNQEEAPEVPLYATAYLNLEEQDVASVQEDPDQTVLRPGFSQPGAAPNFMGRVHMDKVALEFCLVNDEEMTVTGTVRVANIAFNKAVNVHFTIDNWKHVEEVKANYVYYSNDGATDRFSFVIQLPSIFGAGGQMQFALKYEAGSETFWDNNSGHNYKVDCYTREMLQTAANMNYMSSLYPSFTWLQYL